MYRGEGIPDISKELSKSPITRIVEDIDCWAPRRVVTLTYTGPNIREIVKRTPEVLRRGMFVTGLSTAIDDYYLDVVDPNLISFHIFWHGVRPLDHRSKMWAWIRLKQGKLRPDGSGSVEIEFFAKVITTWEKKTILQRNPIYDLFRKIYTYIYYDHRRRMFIKQCKEYQQNMIRLMKEILKMVETAKYPHP